ncbi:Sphingosine kinase [Lachnellula occidentalis]|uniref:Sphingosine kinase n=1 Tax=Lachnellula occidentalis TaxID=215460 RepID=A0A8H8S378_9HELO|nr:Sphingosine kinase [Lachnellula occidentalis]
MTAPSSSSDGTYPSSDSDTESSTTNYGQYGHPGEEPKPVYREGSLSWAKSTLKDEDIITVTKDEGNEYTIFSLAPADPDGQGRLYELRTTFATLLPQAFLDKHLFRTLPQHLLPPNTLHVLISTLSGTGLAPDFFDEVLHPLLKAVGLADPSYIVLRTKSTESVKEFAKSRLLAGANAGSQQTVLMLSGDGGMVDTINGLLEEESRSSNYVPPVLSQLPLGTGNALFHSLHRPSPLPSIYIQGLRTLLHGTPKPLPIFKAKFSPGARLVTEEGQTATALSNNTLYGAVVASYGLHATLVADSDTTEYRKHGDKRFGLVAKDLLFPESGESPHAYKANVALVKNAKDEVLATKEHGYVLASLVSNLEKTFAISPASEPLDGQLRVLHFGPLGGEKTMDVMKGAYAEGAHVEMEEVGYDAVEGLRIDFLEEGTEWKWRRCCIDGLIVGVEEGGWMEVQLVPKGAEAVLVVSDV